MTCRWTIDQGQVCKYSQQNRNKTLNLFFCPYLGRLVVVTVHLFDLQVQITSINPVSILNLPYVIKIVTLLLNPIQSSQCPFYTITFFHLPFLNNTTAVTVIRVSATGMAMNTPVGPSLKYLASR